MRAWLFIGLGVCGAASWVTSPCAAQGAEAAVDGAATAATQARAAGVCASDVAEIDAAVAAYRAASPGVVRRALSEYLDHLTHQLAGCVATAAPSTGRSLRDRSGGGAIGGAGDLGELREQGESGPAQPTVSIPTASATAAGTGHFAEQQVLREIRTHRSAVQACYERALRTAPTVHGRVSIEITITTSGAVTNAHVIEDGAGNAGLNACVVGVLSRFRFSPGPTGGSVTYTFPFDFQPTTP